MAGPLPEQRVFVLPSGGFGIGERTVEHIDEGIDPSAPGGSPLTSARYKSGLAMTSMASW
jgi:hypothetical protein